MTASTSNRRTPGWGADGKAAEAPAGSKMPREQRWTLAATLVILAFFASYAYASVARPPAAPSVASDATGGDYAQSGDVPGGGGQSQPGGYAPDGPAGTSGGPGGGAGCACCGGSASSEPVKGKAKLKANLQTINVDTATGGYSPNEITLKAGVPTEITFPPSSGCLGAVIFPDADLQADLSQGATIKLPPMRPGEYQWYCGMQMVFGKLIVE